MRGGGPTSEHIYISKIVAERNTVFARPWRDRYWKDIFTKYCVPVSLVRMLNIWLRDQLKLRTYNELGGTVRQSISKAKHMETKTCQVYNRRFISEISMMFRIHYVTMWHHLCKSLKMFAYFLQITQQPSSADRPNRMKFGHARKRKMKEIHSIARVILFSDEDWY